MQCTWSFSIARLHVSPKVATLANCFDFHWWHGLENVLLYFWFWAIVIVCTRSSWCFSVIRFICDFSMSCLAQCWVMGPKVKSNELFQVALCLCITRSLWVPMLFSCGMCFTYTFYFHSWPFRVETAILTKHESEWVLKILSSSCTIVYWEQSLVNCCDLWACHRYGNHVEVITTDGVFSLHGSQLVPCQLT